MEIHFDFVAFLISRDPSACTSVEHVYNVLAKNVSACFVDFYRQCKWTTISQNLRNFHDKILVNTAFQLHEVPVIQNRKMKARILYLVLLQQGRMPRARQHPQRY